MPIKILDQHLVPQAIISNLINPLVTEKINREFKFAFSTVIDSEKTQYINENHTVEVADNYFDIVYYRKSQDASGLFIEAVCEHVSYRLNEEELEYFTGDGTPESILTALFVGTPFTVRTVDFTNAVTFSIQEETNKRAILIQFAEYLGGELKFDKFKVSILTRRGAATGVQVKIGKNLLGIEKEVDARGDSVKTAYKIDLVELCELPEYVERGYAELERVELGDTVKVKAADIDVDTEQRIVSYAYDPEQKINSEVEIANFIENLTDTLLRIERQTVVKDRLYNGIRIGPENGFEAIRSDLKTRTVMNATEGIKIQQRDGAGTWIKDVFSVNSEGDLVLSTQQVTEIEEGIQTNAAAIIVNAEEIALRVTTETYDTEVGAIDGRLTSAEGSIIVNADQIALRVTQTVYEASNVNLLKNGGAEIYTGISGTNIPDEWLTYQAVPGVCTFTRRVNSQWTINGGASFEISQGVPEAGAYGHYYQSFASPVVGQSYIAHCKLGSHRCTARLRMSFRTALDVTLQYHDETVVNNSTPQNVSVTGVCPVDTTQIVIELIKGDTNEGETTSFLFADNLKLEKGTTKTPFVETEPEIKTASIVAAINNEGSEIMLEADKIKIDGVVALSNWSKTGDVTKIDGGQISANTITANQIAAGTITATEIAANTITAGNIVAGTITGTEIAANTIEAGNIAAGTITGTEIAANTITAGNIAAGTITATELSVATLSAISADLGTITAGTITGVTVTGGTIRTSASGARIEISSNKLNSYNADNEKHGLEIDPSGGFAAAIRLFVLDSEYGRFNTLGDGMEINSAELYFIADGSTKMSMGDWGVLFPGAVEFSGSVAGLVTDTHNQGNHNHGIPHGTVLMVDGGGTVTFVESGGFGHSHAVQAS